MQKIALIALTRQNLPKIAFIAFIAFMVALVITHRKTIITIRNNREKS